MTHAASESCPLRKSPRRIDLALTNPYYRSAGWSSLVARWAHNPKVAGSNPAPATKGIIRLRAILQGASAPNKREAAKSGLFALLGGRQNHTHDFAVGFPLRIRNRLGIDVQVV